MSRRAIILVHRGSPTTALLVAACREKGIEPVVLSSAADPDARARFERLCTELKVMHAMGKPVLEMDDIMAVAGDAFHNVAFCLGVWDGQRALMAEVNELLGAADDPADAIRTVQDKYQFRRMLQDRGLSRVTPYSLDDPTFRRRLASGSPFIVKPRRAAGALCTGRVTSWDDVQKLLASFSAGPDGNDLFEEFFSGNELFAENFVEGVEFSFEVMRRGGATFFMCEHEKLTVRFTGATVLESNFVSPAISVTGGQLHDAASLVNAAFDTFGLAHGAYHVEARIDDRGTWELLEINPRPGGGLITESVRRQYGRVMLSDWLDILTGSTPALNGERSCGTLFQVHFAHEPRPIIGLEKNANMREPDVFKEVIADGARGRANREEIVSAALWRTDLTMHPETVAELAAHDYVTVRYGAPATSAPAQARRASKLFLVFEPLNHIYKVISAAKRRGLTVVAFHTLPLESSGVYASASSDIAEAHRIDSWADHDANFARIIDACAGRQVVGTYAAHEPILELEARMQEHFALPSKTAAFITRYLDKMNVREELRRHGLTKLRVFDAKAVATMTSWPVGDRALYFKPIRGTASAYVRRCTSFSDMREAVASWEHERQPCAEILRQHLKSGNGYFFEEEAKGELMSLEGYVYRGDYRALGLTSRTVLERDITIEMGATFPYPHPSYDAVVTKVAAIHKALRVPHGATHAELVVSPDGEIELVELNLRFAGADVLLLADAAYDATVEDILVDLALGGEPDDALPSRPRRYASLHYFLPPAGAATFESIDLSNADIMVKKIMKSVGTRFAPTVSQSDMMAGFITCAETYRNAVERACSIRRTVRINGQPIERDPNNIVIAR